MEKLQPVLPEIIVLLSLIAALFGGFRTASRTFVNRAVLWGFAMAAVVLLMITVPEKGLSFEKPMVVLDRFSVCVKLLILAGASLALAFGADWLAYKKYGRFEYGVLLGFSVFGMMLAVSANDFLMQFLGLEAMQTPLIFLTAYKRQGERSTEAGTKYVISCLLGSGLWLFGVSVIYACLGTSDFAKIALMSKENVMPALLFGLAFATAGLFIKTGIVPFHFWLPDVFEGAPSPVTAFFALCVRLPLFAVLARWGAEPFRNMEFYWAPVSSFAAVLCVFTGALGLLTQTSVKRFLAYGIILSDGFMLAALGADSLSAFLTGAMVGTVLTAGLCGIMLSLRVGSDLGEELRLLNGQGKEKPVRGALFTLIFLGLSGLPPFAGFWGHFSVWEAGYQAGYQGMSVLLMAGSVIPVYAFLKLVRQMYFARATDELLPAPKPMKLAILAAAGMSVFLPVFMRSLSEIAAAAVTGAG